MFREKLTRLYTRYSWIAVNRCPSSSFSTRRLIPFQKDILSLPSFFSYFRKFFFRSNAPPLSDISSREHFSREGENEESKRERGFCVPDSICRIRSSPEFIPALKILRRPLDMNRATVDRFLFCHLFSLPLPFRSSLFRDFYFHRTHQTFRSHCALIRSHDFSRARKITREGSCSPFRTM